MPKLVAFPDSPISPSWTSRYENIVCSYGVRKTAVRRRILVLQMRIIDWCDSSSEKTISQCDFLYSVQLVSQPYPKKKWFT